MNMSVLGVMLRLELMMGLAAGEGACGHSGSRTSIAGPLVSASSV